MTTRLTVGLDSLDVPVAPTFPTDLDRLRGLAQAFKLLFEARRWAELGEHVRVPWLWTFDRPMTTAEALGHLETIFRNAIDMHLWIERILKAETGETDGHLSLNCCLMWGEEGTFKDHEFEMDLHFGFRRTGAPENAEHDGWEITYLGVSPGTAENIPFPQDEKDKKDDKDGKDEPGMTTAPLPLPAADGEPVPPGYVRVWMPALVPAGALRTETPTDKPEEPASR
jgi:hypothetical protein